MSQGLVNGGSTDEGLCLLVGETCARRLVPGTTWVSLPTINPVRASSAPMLRGVQVQITMIQRLRYNANLRHDAPYSPLVPNFSIPTGYFVVGFPGDPVMEAQFGRAPLASPPALALVAGAGADRPLIRAPNNVRSDRTLRRSSVDSRIPFPSFVEILCSSAMADNTADAARLFAVA